VEKNQYKLCLEILRRFHKTGILKDIILIGSWCVHFYKDYFKGIDYIDSIALKTRDIDFLIDHPARIKQKVDIPELLSDLGFVTIFKGNQGYIKLDHPDLILEFLVPERGRGIEKPFPLPQLGLNATTLRFLNFLTDQVIKVRIENFVLTLPHPSNFALHKLIICQRRQNKEKSLKDRNTALEIIKALIKKGEGDLIKKFFDSIPQKWQKKIINGLKNTNDHEIIKIII
jgi:hypothetical protein